MWHSKKKREIGCQISEIQRSEILNLASNEELRDKLKIMMDENLEIDAVHRDGVTLFHLSCQRREFGVANYLLDLGANPRILPSGLTTYWYFELIDNECYTSVPNIQSIIEFMQKLCSSNVLRHNKKTEASRFEHLLMFACNHCLRDVFKYTVEYVCFRTQRNCSDIFSIFQKCCSNNWTDEIAAMLKAGYTIHRYDLIRVFETSSLVIIEMLCNKSLGAFQDLQAFDFENLFQRNDKEIEHFICKFVKHKSLCWFRRLLFVKAVVSGNSQYVDTFFQIHSAKSCRKFIDDGLFDEIFRKFELSADNNDARMWARGLQSIVTSLTKRTTTATKLGQLFRRKSIQVLVEIISEDRLDTVEKLIKYHVMLYRAKNTCDPVGTLSDPGCFKKNVNLILAAFSCRDYEMVRYLTSRSSNINDVDEDSSFEMSPLVPALMSVMYCISFSKKLAIEGSRNFDVDSALEATKKLVTDFADISQISQSHFLFEYVIQNIDSSTFEFHFRFLQFLLDLGLQMHDHYQPRTVVPLRITYFITDNDRARMVIFYLFQAGADPSFIYKYNQANRWRRGIYDTYVCRVLVLECNRENVRIDFEDYVNRNGNGEQLKNSAKEFLDWCEQITSSPFSLICQCRTMIRRQLVSVSGHRSILRRIDSLNLPEVLKQYLKYEGRLTEVDLSCNV